MHLQVADYPTPLRPITDHPSRRIPALPDYPSRPSPDYPVLTTHLCPLPD